jgi:ribosomal protein S18 acetylase RimI-like enzyme
MQIRPFAAGDREAVVRLWERCDLVRPWNDPHKDIARKLTVQSDLFLVGVLEDRVVAVVMAGYEGHRGWVNYLAVEPALRGRGFGQAMMAEAESRLRALGCPKVSLQIRRSNLEVARFYASLGYTEDDVICMGKRLERDDR